MKKIIINLCSLVLGILLISTTFITPIMASKTNHSSNINKKLNNTKCYTVCSDDSVWSIGMKLNIKPKVLEQILGISNPYKLPSGINLKLYVYDHNKKARLTITNMNNITIKSYLTSNDRLDKNEILGKTIKHKNLTSKEKKTMNYELHQNQKFKQNTFSSSSLITNDSQK